jgi:hypothetical protein
MSTSSLDDVVQILTRPHNHMPPLDVLTVDPQESNPTRHMTIDIN